MNDPSKLKPYLNRLLARFDRSYLEPDPLAAVPPSGSTADIETACLFAALFAYGRADLIQRNVSNILKAMGPSPSAFCETFKPSMNREWMKGFVYRFNRREDLVAVVKAAGAARREYGSLLNLFMEKDDPSAETILPGLTGMAKTLRRLSGRKTAAFNTLVTDPAQGSASKRWNLYLRWMVRKDGVDPGPWSGAVSTSRLVIPLDTHVARIARRLGMLARKSNDWKAALELTRFLRRLDSRDPVKYDFAMCSYGKLGYCVSKADSEKCESCDLDPVCFNGL